MDVVKPRPVQPADAFTLPARYYADPTLFHREIERIFATMWVCAGRADQIPAPGDYFVREIGGESVIVTRDRSGAIGAFFNVCRHRGTRLCAEASGHFTETIQCPYHAWTYGLDGRLVAAPHMDEVPHFRRDEYPLHRVALEEWDGHIFLNLAEAPRQRLHEQLARPGFSADDVIEFWDETNKQDWHVSEQAQLGIGSRAYRPGPYSNREDLLYAFDRWVVGMIGDEGAEVTAAESAEHPAVIHPFTAEIAEDAEADCATRAVRQLAGSTTPRVKHAAGRRTHAARGSQTTMYNAAGESLAMRETQCITADELLRMPDDGFLYELVEGKLKRMSPPGSEHGLVWIRLGAALSHHVEAGRLGLVVAETGFTLARDPDTVRAPDVAFVRRDRIPATGVPKGYWPGAPDLAVEVVSPGDSRAEINEKIAEYFAAGARQVWIVDPAPRTVTIYEPSAAPLVLGADDTLDGRDLVAGFRYSLERLWVIP